MTWKVSRSYRPDPRSSRSARAFCTQQLGAVLGDSALFADTYHTAALIVSELVTNAVNAGSATICLRLEVADAALRISVRDDAAGTPRERHADVDDVHGRGLAIVDSLSRTWGVTELEQGKRVWADVALPGDLARAAR